MVTSQAQTNILTEFILTLSRIAVADKHMFLQLMAAAPQVAHIPEAQLWEAVLNHWWTRVSYDPHSIDIISTVHTV